MITIRPVQKQYFNLADLKNVMMKLNLADIKVYHQLLGSLLYVVIGLPLRGHIFGCY
jgi:hypothetical protein